jgi:cation transport ATPase
MIKMMTVLVGLLLSFNSLAATSIKAEVNGMVCAFCAKGIEKKLNALPQGQGAYVDLKKRIVVLELKENQDVPINQFTKAIEDAGYSVSKVDKVKQSIVEIKASLQTSEGRDE